MKKNFKKPRQAREIVNLEGCPFCKEGTNPDYKDYKKLTKFLSERAKILHRTRTGVCASHQRKLSKAIKRARTLGLLPYTPAI